MNTSRFLVSVLAIIAIPSALAAKTDVYKWKDKDGVIHYSQNAPQDQEKVEVITTKTPRAPLPEGAVDVNQTTNSSVSSDDQKKSPKPIVVQKDQATCDKATKMVEELQKPIIMRDGKIMTIDEKNEEIKKQQEIMEVHCP